jgi:hypothetical protein
MSSYMSQNVHDLIVICRIFQIFLTLHAQGDTCHLEALQEDYVREFGGILV